MKGVSLLNEQKSILHWIANHSYVKLGKKYASQFRFYFIWNSTPLVPPSFMLELTRLANDSVKVTI